MSPLSERCQRRVSGNCSRDNDYHGNVDFGRAPAPTPVEIAKDDRYKDDDYTYTSIQKKGVLTSFLYYRIFRETSLTKCVCCYS